jgi:hypothetical protein
VLTLDDNAQRDVQNRLVNGVPCAYLFGCANPAQASAALANPSIYNQFLSEFEMRHRRDTAAVGLTYNATMDAAVRSVKKEGEQPWGASFAFNNAAEVPVPVDHRTNDLSANVEWARPRGMVRVGWDGSWFNNDVPTLVWDNPIRLTDFDSGTGTRFDPSGYSNGNGPAQGRFALWPSNTMHVVSATGLYKLPRRSSINGALQFTRQNQDEPLIPWTTNTVILTAVPSLQTLPRNTAEASVDGISALVNFSTRPLRALGLQVRYRYNDRDVQTPERRNSMRPGASGSTPRPPTTRTRTSSTSPERTSI